jgi:phosphate transport system ATP-binding protein
MKLPIPTRKEQTGKGQSETTNQPATTTTSNQAETTTTTDQAQTPAVGDVPKQAQAPTDGATAPAREGGHAVTLRGLNAYYGRQHAIKDVNIEFRANEVTALIGPSGSGKSTVVRCINRMHEEIPGARAEGEVLLDELNLYDPSVDLTSVRRAIGMVFQKPNPFPTMSIFDNVAAGIRLTGKSRGANLRERVHKSLRSVGLWEEVKNRLTEPGNSSGCASRGRSPWNPR